MSRPNVLILFSDQHNAGVLGSEGHPDVRTPNLDRLAAAGVRFRRAYCQDAICTPSRCSMFSGLYPRTLGCRWNSDRTPVMDEVVSLPLAFQRNGYRTAAYGKRHLYMAIDEGWDEKASHLRIESPDDNYVDWVAEQGHADAFNRDWAAEFGRGAEQTPAHDIPQPDALFTVRESRLPEDLTMEAWTKMRTVDFIHRMKDGDQPFFCLASFYRPHQPYTPLPRYYNRFDRGHWGQGRKAGDGLARPASLTQPVETLPPRLQEQTLSTEGPWQFHLARTDEQLFRDLLAAYYALVEEIDDHVGEILAALQETGQLENTIILYSADHGDFAGEHGMGEKCAVGQNVYEATVRVPFIVSQPGTFPAGVESDELVELVDIFPTLLEHGGIAEESLENKLPLDGRSLVPLLKGENIPWRRYTVTESWNQSTVITARHKLGVWTEPPEGVPYRDHRDFGDMLFDREKDPHEMHNVAGAGDYREVEQELRAYLDEWVGSHPVAEGGAVTTT